MLGRDVGKVPDLLEFVPIESKDKKQTDECIILCQGVTSAKK